MCYVHAAALVAEYLKRKGNYNHKICFAAFKNISCILFVISKTDLPF